MIYKEIKELKEEGGDEKLRGRGRKEMRMVRSQKTNKDKTYNEEK